MMNNKVDEAQRHLEYEVDEETVRQIEAGFPKYQAIERAQKIVRNRRKENYERKDWEERI